MKFRCIVADPPWPYGRHWDAGSRSAKFQNPEAIPIPYKQMSLKEIMSLKVSEWADDQCELYLWTTQRYLPHSFGVVEAWGFRYCQTLSWCKEPRGTGQGGLYCPTTEFLILARRGSMPLGKTRKDTTWWHIKRQRKHSEKPSFFQDLIEKQSDPPRLEMFSRKPRTGWYVWGDEVRSDIHIKTTMAP